MWLVTVACFGILLLAACASEPTPSANTSSWEYQIQVGIHAVERGELALAIECFERAVALAGLNPRRLNRLASATWHLADVCFKNPGRCPPGRARRDTLASYEIFAAHYGPEHPVVIPVLLRLSEIRAEEGDLANARALREQADRITARTFPEAHFMRARMGDHRPAESLHPTQLLEILAELDRLGG